MATSIDQSGKIENTSKATILCLSNDKWDAVLIPSKVKRQIQEMFKRNGKIRNFIFFTFAASLALLIRRNNHLKHVVIDREYFGKEAIIKNILLRMLKNKKSPPNIVFSNIGKRAMAHNRAYAIAIGKLRTKKTLSLNEILYQIKKTEVGKRLKNA